MKLKISEKVISEFIGMDLEPNKGSLPTKNGDDTYVNLTNDRGEAPPTTTDLNRQASKENFLLKKYLWGYYGGGQRGFASESQEIKEDVFAKNDPDKDIINPNQYVELSDISKLFGEEVLEQNVREFVENISDVAKRKSDEEMKGITYIILSHIIDNLNTTNLSSSEKIKLINGIK